VTFAARPTDPCLVRIDVLLCVAAVRSLVIALLLVAAPAWAEDREAAAIHFQAAQAAEKRADYKTAIEEYERAYRLAPHPSVLFNMANNYEKLGDLRHAAEYLGRYLRDDPRAEDRPVVERRITGLRDRPSVLHVGEPRGATLLLDGQPHGTLPTSIDIPAGAHRIQAERDGARSTEQEVTAEFGEPLDVNLFITPRQLPPPDQVYSRASLGMAAGLAIQPAIGNEWDSSARVAFTGRLRGTLSVSRRLRAFAELGGSAGPFIEDVRVDTNLGPKEAFFTFGPRGGITYSLLQRSTVRLDAVGFGTLITGYHKLAFGTETVAKQAIFGAGAGGGIEIAGTSSKAPHTQYYAQLTYAVIPTAVGSDTGFRATGTVDLGGFDIIIGVSVLIGKPAQPTPSGIVPTGSWSARR
jgi:hypothetical protein